MVRRGELVGRAAPAVLALAVLASLAALAGGGWLRQRYLTPRPARGGKALAVWAGHRWVGEPTSDQEVASLAGRLAAAGVTDLYLHAGPLDARGEVDPARYARAGEFLSRFRPLAPAVRLHAWLGQRERRWQGPLDLGDQGTRGRIAATAAGLRDLGFDGIHYNIEPISSGDPAFLDLLDRTRASARGGLLGVSGFEMLPLPGLDSLGRLLRISNSWWSGAYYDRVAEAVDQIAVMTYDSALARDWLYGTLVAWQTRLILARAGHRTQVLMGVPSYEDRRRNFHPAAENVRSGLQGIRLGLAGLPPESAARCGVALYAEWTTDREEWELLARRWTGGAVGAPP